MDNKQSFVLTGSNGKEIIGDITYSATKSNLVALFVHGFKGFKDWGTHNIVAKYFAAHGINYVKFNFSYSGVVAADLTDVTDMDLFASNTPSKELFDLAVVIKHVSEVFPNPNITLIGHSRGGGISILEAARKNTPVNKLITWAAISSFDSLWKKEQEPQWREKGIIEVYNARTKENMPLNVELLDDVTQHAEQLDILKAAKTLRLPWLIIHGDEDVNVSISVGREFKKNNPAASFIKIDRTNHVFGASHPYHGDQLPGALQKVCEASVKFIRKRSGNDA
jgi:pimeloyl-ACP methyl ester carboxylesterase